MYRIAHISDSHICFEDSEGNGKKLVEVLDDIKKRECDHVFVTGDLAENPVLKDMMLVREIFSQFDLLDQSKLSLIPGNHDIFGGAPRGNMFFRFPKICKDENYKENLEQFIDSFRESFPEKAVFPYLKILENVAVIGINSVDVWSENKNPEGSNGRVNGKQYKKIKKILSSDELTDKYKVILIHHHFDKPTQNEDFPAHSLWIKVINWKMKLYGKNKLIRLFKKYNVNLIFHGHTHINQIYNINKVTFVNSSASCAPITDDQIRSYNIISFPGENDKEKSITVETIVI